jgi:hypothetical protein
MHDGQHSLRGAFSWTSFQMQSGRRAFFSFFYSIYRLALITGFGAASRPLRRC